MVVDGDELSVILRATRTLDPATLQGVFELQAKLLKSMEDYPLPVKALALAWVMMDLQASAINCTKSEDR